MGLLDRLKAAAMAKPQSAVLPGSTGISREFAVVDVETTGLDPRIHRIIEVGVVVTDARGNVRDEFCTLVQPEGELVEDTRARHVHLIATDWLKAAPPTSAVLVEVAHRLNGRVVVAHNAMFDTEFLQQEFKRCLGYTDDDLGDWTTLCTVDLCRAVDIPRKLDRACFELGVRYEKHSALGDCHATARLLHCFMSKIDPQTFAMAGVTRFRRMPDWKPATRVDRSQASKLTNARPVLEELINALPPHDGTTDGDPAGSDAYLVALQDAIADGYISPQEVNSLKSSATRLGLTSDEVRDLHQELILGLVDTALEDRRVSKAERAEIEKVAAWLNVDVSDWDAMVVAARARIKAVVGAFRSEMVGKTVAFSGAGIHKPNIREALAAKHHFGYETMVGRGTDLLIIGTDHTDTAQVRSARERGVPIMVETTFWRRLGEV